MHFIILGLISLFLYLINVSFLYFFLCANGITHPLSPQSKFMESVKEVTTWQFLSAVSQLCHMDTSLAEWVWLQFFPRIWKILSEKQQQVGSGVEALCMRAYMCVDVFSFIYFYIR